MGGQRLIASRLSRRASNFSKKFSRRARRSGLENGLDLINVGFECSEEVWCSRTNQSRRADDRTEKWLTIRAICFDGRFDDFSHRVAVGTKWILVCIQSTCQGGVCSRRNSDAEEDPEGRHEVNLVDDLVMTIGSEVARRRRR